MKKIKLKGNWSMKEKHISLTKIFSFNSAHKLIDYKGKCSQIHGHTYKLEFTVSGKISSDGMVIDFHVLNDIIEKEIIEELDHKYLNDIFDFNPTSENIAIWIWERVENTISDIGCNIERIVLWETPTSFVTIRSEDIK